MMETTIQVRQRGTLTLPAELREKYGIQPIPSDWWTLTACLC
jgi:bifunctional DNA-binding transcriptional regulator/antitoxin component of YhaV-PrlF toxin-antitoxin module